MSSIEPSTSHASTYATDVQTVFLDYVEQIKQECMRAEESLVPTLLRKIRPNHASLFKGIWDKCFEAMGYAGASGLLDNKEMPLEMQKKLAPGSLNGLDRSLFQSILKVRMDDFDFLPLKHLLNFSLLSLFVAMHERKKPHTSQAQVHFLNALVNSYHINDKGIKLNETFVALLAEMGLEASEATPYQQAFRAIWTLHRLTGCQNTSCRDLLSRQAGDEFSSQKIFLKQLKRLIPSLSKITDRLMAENFKKAKQLFSESQGFMKTGKIFDKNFELIEETLSVESQLIKWLPEDNVQDSKGNFISKITPFLSDFESLRHGRKLKLEIISKKFELFYKWLVDQCEINMDPIFFPTSHDSILKEVNVLLEGQLTLAYFLRHFGESIKDVANSSTEDLTISEQIQIPIEIYKVIVSYFEEAKDIPFHTTQREKIIEKASEKLKPVLPLLLDRLEKLRLDYLKCRLFSARHRLTRAPFLNEIVIPKNYVPSQPPYKELLSYFKGDLALLQGAKGREQEIRKQANKMSLRDFFQMIPRKFEMSAHNTEQHCFTPEFYQEAVSEYEKTRAQGIMTMLGRKVGTVVLKRGDEFGKTIKGIKSSIATMINLSKLFDEGVYSLFKQCLSGIKVEEVDLADESWLTKIDKEEETPFVEVEDLDVKESVDEKKEMKTFSENKVVISPQSKSLPLSPYDTVESYLVGQLREGLALYFGMRSEIIAPHEMWRRNLSLLQTTQAHLLYYLDLLQSTLEERSQNQDEKIKIFLDQRYQQFFHLIYEQLLTAEYINQNDFIKNNQDQVELTHDLNDLMRELHLKQTLQQFQNKSYGTSEYRYPSSFKVLQRAITDEMVSQNLKVLMDVIKSLGISLNIAEVQAEPKRIERDKSSDQEYAKLIQLFEGVKKTFQLHLKKIVIVDEKTKQTCKSLINCDTHLANLSLVPLLMRQFPQQRFIHNHMRESLFSMQYFLENFGVYLSLKKGKEMRTHDLSLYCSDYELDKGLTEEEVTLIQALNAKKSSEYPYRFTNVKGMRLLSDRYCRSRSATLAGDGFISSSIKEVALAELQKEDRQLLQKMGQLIEKLVSIHFRD